MFAADLDPTAVVAFVAGCLALASTAITLRSRAQAALHDDLVADREWARKQVGTLRGEVDALILQSHETERALVACRDSERRLQARVAELEAAQ